MSVLICLTLIYITQHCLFRVKKKKTQEFYLQEKKYRIIFLSKSHEELFKRSCPHLYIFNLNHMLLKNKSCASTNGYRLQIIFCLSARHTKPILKQKTEIMYYSNISKAGDLFRWTIPCAAFTKHFQKYWFTSFPCEDIKTIFKSIHFGKHF